MCVCACGVCVCCVCVCVCVCLCVCVCMRACVVCVFGVCVCVCVCVHACVCGVCVCVCVCMRACVVCVCVCMRACVVCVCVYARLKDHTSLAEGCVVCHPNSPGCPCLGSTAVCLLGGVSKVSTLTPINSPGPLLPPALLYQGKATHGRSLTSPEGEGNWEGRGKRRG